MLTTCSDLWSQSVLHGIAMEEVAPTKVPVHGDQHTVPGPIGTHPLAASRHLCPTHLRVRESHPAARSAEHGEGKTRTKDGVTCCRLHGLATS